MKFNFKYKGENFSMDVKRCKSVFSKATGLMFRKKSKPLLFVFNRPTRQSIHSFFCQPFVAIWFNNNKIVEVKIVKPRIFSVKPKKRFNLILEIPINDKNFSRFVDGHRKI